MIKIRNPWVGNIDGAFRGLRFPMNSVPDGYYAYGTYNPGPEDLKLAHKLIKAGPDHAKFMRQIMVCLDITAPLYFWKEMDQYKVGTTTDSSSTMHTISKKPFELDDFSYEHLLTNEYFASSTDLAEFVYTPVDTLQMIIHMLNECREAYLKTGDKRYWWQLIQLLPSSYNQKRCWTGSFANLANIYGQRKNHKLDEWREFCDYISNPSFDKYGLISGKENNYEDN